MHPATIKKTAHMHEILVLMNTELSLKTERTCEMRYSYAFGFKVYLYEKCLGFPFNTKSFGS